MENNQNQGSQPSFSFNQGAFNQELRVLKEGLISTQTLIDTFHETAICKLRDVSDVEGLINGGKKWIETRVLELIEKEKPKIGIFKMKSTALLKNLDLPDLEPIENMSLALRENIYSFRGSYTFNDGKLTLKPFIEDELTKRFSIVAKTAAQIKLYDAHVKAAKALQTLNDALLDAGGYKLPQENLQSLFSFSTEEIKLSSLYYENNWHRMKNWENR